MSVFKGGTLSPSLPAARCSEACSSTYPPPILVGSRFGVSKAVGPEDVARLALRETRSDLEEDLLMANS
jgi:hypothetical protein